MVLFMAVMALVAQLEQAAGAAADGIANGGPAADRECAHQPDYLDGSVVWRCEQTGRQFAKMMRRQSRWMRMAHFWEMGRWWRWQ